VTTDRNHTGLTTAFPLYVTEPGTGVVHRWFDVADRVVETLCGRDCAAWPCLLGGRVTCETCRNFDPRPGRGNDA
jgi:hypothetical protein